MTKTVLVNLNWVNDVNFFVKACTASSCDILLESEQYRINGKSLLGVFSLDLSKPIIVKITGESEKEIDNLINQFTSMLVTD